MLTRKINVMKLSEFIVLNEAEKKHAVMNYAVPLASRTFPGFVIFLFQLDGYYVEAYCNDRNKAIEEYCVLPGVNAIGHYLQAITIDGLLS